MAADGELRRVRLLHDRVGVVCVEGTTRPGEVVAAPEGTVGELVGQWSTVDGLPCPDVLRLRVATPHGPADLPVIADEFEDVASDDA